MNKKPPYHDHEHGVFTTKQKGIGTTVSMPLITSKVYLTDNEIKSGNIITSDDAVDQKEANKVKERKNNTKQQQNNSNNKSGDLSPLAHSSTKDVHVINHQHHKSAFKSNVMDNLDNSRADDNEDQILQDSQLLAKSEYSLAMYFIIII
ncbi:unnamed protein product [Ceratitis capitata]|uniref:(Mediterranean fruit fly) hypothetical protein n=1 Tax=Ceratitis capitata TaxID=7213 RepID=A0A811UWL6_CERCA|nr:unnamed protein product [Ceratitis capitata]